MGISSAQMRKVIRVATEESVRWEIRRREIIAARRERINRILLAGLMMTIAAVLLFHALAGFFDR